MMTLAEFATVKTICATVGLVLFMGIFIAVGLWVFRPHSASYYQNQARKILED